VTKTGHDVTGLRNEQEARTSHPGLRSNVNQELNSFEAVMNAMDIELSCLRTSTKMANKKPQQEQPQPSQPTTGKGKEKAYVAPQEDIEAAMEAELKTALERGEDEESESENQPMDYNLIKNFLESFKSQAGLSGPVSNLAGRLQPGFQLPRDDT
jgi:hypothetical protein